MTTTIAPIEQELEQQTTSAVSEAAAFTVVDQVSYAAAGERILGLKELQRRISEHHDPICESAHRTHRLAVAARDKLLQPLREAEAQYKSKGAYWWQQQERLRQEEQARLEAEARRRAEDEALAAAEAAKAQGATPEQVDAILEQPVVVQIPIAPPTVTRVPGISAPRKVYKARVDHPMALVRAVAAGQVPLAVIKFDEALLNRQAAALKELLNWPGVTVYEAAPIVSARRG